MFYIFDNPNITQDTLCINRLLVYVLLVHIFCMIETIITEVQNHKAYCNYCNLLLYTGFW
jgi:hypothetical protein